MTRRNRKKLVIDANIASSAGAAPAPVSLHSRHCLEVIRRDEHIAVFNSQLRREWKNHASLIAKQWQVAMQQRRRIIDVEGDEFAYLSDPASACLAEAAWGIALRKDFHLVQSALGADQLILSNENALPTYLRRSCESVPELRNLYFGNPEREGTDCIGWIKAGAKKEPKRRADRFLQA